MQNDVHMEAIGYQNKIDNFQITRSIQFSKGYRILNRIQRYIKYYIIIHGLHDVKHVEADHVLQMKQMEQIAEIKTVIMMKSTWKSIIIFLPSSIP